MDSDYRLIREKFYGGHNGSTVVEVVAITSVNQLSNFLLVAVFSLFPVLTHNNKKWLRYIVEYLLIMTPFVSCVTFLSNYVFLVCFSIVLTTFVVIVFCFIRRQNKPIVLKEFLDSEIPYEGRIPFLTNLFSTLLLCVCIAILGVDFRIFSRRFAKTEIYGWSLMDVGVGSFVAINGGFSPESRLGTNSRYKPMFLFKKTVISTIPLLVLGLQRMIAIKSLDYYEHITEYGEHWNFFFTLAFTKLFSTTFCCLFSNKVNIGFCGIALLVFHQIGLSSGWSQFIQNEDRSGLLSANKEGIISLLGYISLYLVFVEIGKYVIKKRTRMREWFWLSFVLFSMSLIFGLLMILSDIYIENVSRREVNLSFVCWMIALNSLFIGLEFLIQTIVHFLEFSNIFISGDSHRSIIFSSIGYNGMLVFLASNLLTGCVNFTIDTVRASDLLSITVLIGYSIVLSLVSVLCHKYKIQIKIPFKLKSD